MNQADVISVIIPVYNGEKHLKACVDSVVNQTYRNLEILLIDDGSSDSSPKICDEYARRDKRVRVIHKENGGVSTARNAGIDAAKGQYVTFVDSDDWIDESMIEFLLENAKANNSDISMCGIFAENESKQWENCFSHISADNAQVYTGKEIVKCFLRGDVFAYGPFAKLYKKEIINNLKFDISMKRAEDGYFVYFCCKASKRIVIQNSCKYYYRYVETSAMHTIKDMKDDMRFVRRVYEKEKNDNEVIVERTLFCKRFIIRLCYEAVSHNLFQTGWRDARKSMIPFQQVISNIDRKDLKNIPARTRMFYMMILKAPNIYILMIRLLENNKRNNEEKKI